VIFPGAVGFEFVLGMLRALRVLGVATVLLFDECCGVVLRLMEPANCELGVATVLLFDEPCGVVLRLMEPVNCELGVATVLLFDESCGVVLRLMEPANCELVIFPGAVGFEVVLGVLRVFGVFGVFGVVAALLFDECCGVEKSCRVVALEVVRA